MDETQSRPQERLEELGAGLTQTKRGNIYTLTIIGQIDCLTYGEGGLRGCGG